MKRLWLIAILLWSSAALAQSPNTTQLAIGMLLSPCSANVPVVGNGSGVLTKCYASALPSALGSGISAALGTNVGSAGAPVLFNGAGGTPSSLTLTNATGLPTTGLTGTLQAAQFPALTGDITTSAGSLATTLATVNANTGSWGTATQAPQITINGKGLITAAANVTVTPAIGSVTGLGTGVATALGNTTNANSGVVTQAAFSSYTPTVTSTSGTLTTVTNNGSSSMTMGNVIFVQFDFTLTTVGTGTGFLDVSVPTYNSIVTCGAFEMANGNGFATANASTSTTIRLKSYNNGTTVHASDRWQGGCTLRLS